MKTVKYTSSIPGTGKTTAFINKIKKEYEKKKFIVVLPTVELQTQVSTKLRGLNVVSVNNKYDGFDTSVIRELRDSIKSQATIILITHACLNKINTHTAKMCRDYHLIIDEVFNPNQWEQLYLEDSIDEPGGLFNTAVKRTPVLIQDAEVILLSKGDPAEFELRRQKLDSIHTVDTTKTRELLNYIKDTSKEVFLYKQERSRKANSFCVCVRFNVNNLRFFKAVLVMSAFLEHTMLFNLISQRYAVQDVTAKMIPRKNIIAVKDRMRLLDLYYLVEERYSWTFRRNHKIKEIATKGKVLDRKPLMDFKDYTSVVMVDPRTPWSGKSLRVCNNDENAYIKESGIGVLVTSSCHGQNQYSSEKGMVIVAAHNGKPFYSAMESILYKDHNQWFENNVLLATQCLFRTSVRTHGAASKVSILLSCKQVAEAVKLLLNNTPSIKEHALLHEYKVVVKKARKIVKVRKTRAERQKAYRDRKKAVEAVTKVVKVAKTPAEVQKAYRARKKLENLQK